MTRYFEMHDNVHVPHRWYLADPTDRHGQLLDWVFSDGERVQIDGPIQLSFNKYAEPGVPVDYSELSIESVPVVHVRVASVFAELAAADVQLVPVQIPQQPDQFCIVNVTRVVKCIDDQRSKQVEYYTLDSDKVFHDRIGQYSSVFGMRIDPTKVGDAKVFRTWGWRPAIIVSEDVKEALQAINTVGVKFEEV